MESLVKQLKNTTDSIISKINRINNIKEQIEILKWEMCNEEVCIRELTKTLPDLSGSINVDLSLFINDAY